MILLAKDCLKGLEGDPLAIRGDEADKILKNIGRSD